jgi:hypothetical protein
LYWAKDLEQPGGLPAKKGLALAVRVSPHTPVRHLRFLMEECVPMPDTPNELLFSFLSMTVSAKGSVAFFVAAAVSILILAVAARLMPPRF